MQLTDIILKKNVLLGSSSKKTNAKSRRRQNLDDDPMNYNYDIRPERSYDGLVTGEHSYMTSDFLGEFLTYLPTIIRYFTT